MKRPSLPSIPLDKIVVLLLDGDSADRALDALVNAVGNPSAGADAISPEVAARLATREPLLNFTADVEAISSLARSRGMISLTCLSEGGFWGAVWLPPPLGDRPVTMLGRTAARALCAAYVEAHLVEYQSRLRRRS